MAGVEPNSPSNEDDILKRMEETSMADFAISDISMGGGAIIKGSFGIESSGSFPSK